MAEPVALPQHVLDTRYLQELSARILASKYGPSPSDEGEEEEETMVEKLAYDLEDAAAGRWCHCDPDERWEEGCDEDSDKEDGWFCSYRGIEDEYKMHAVLEHARSDIEADPTEVSEAIYKEIAERCNLEHTKVLEAQARKQARSNQQIQASPPLPCVFPPFSLQQLPPEILTEIALLAQASDPYAHINLSHVDAFLRTFVNTTRLLWSRIDFLYPLHVVHRFLERSVDVLLTVTALPPLHVGSYQPPELKPLKEHERHKLEEFMRALRPHRHRIHSLRLRCHDLMFEVSGENEGPTPAHDLLWDGSMVALELLDLELGSWTWDDITPVPSSYPLKELHVHGSWTDQFLPLFSTRLKSLVITDERAPFSKIFDALQAAPQLMSLTFRDMSLMGIAERKGSALDLDHLESLKLIRVLGSAAEAVLNCIVAPNLTSLALQLVDTLHSVKELKDINQRQLFPVPRPAVRHLDLITCEGDYSFFDSILWTFPHLTHLRIASSNLSDNHLLLLAQPSDSSTSGDDFELGCPNLKHLTIDNEFRAITEVIKKFVHLRRALGSPLESLTLRGISVDRSVLEGLTALDEIVPQVEIAEFDQDLDVYEDSDDGSISETSSEGDWASGDEEIVTTSRTVGGTVHLF